MHGKPLLGLSGAKEYRNLDQHQDMDMEEKFERRLQDATALCLEYLKLAGNNANPSLNTLDECLQNIGDFGLGSIQSLIDLLGNQPVACISDPADPRLPSSLRECQAGIVLQISPGRYLNAQDRFRIEQCTPPSDACGMCAPMLSVEDAGFSYVYQCAAYQAYTGFLKYELLDGMKAGEFACGYKYLGASDPLQCLKDYLPSVFNQ